MKTNIRELRKARSMTLQQLAELVGTTAQTIQRLETGNMTISLSWLKKISVALGTSISALIEGDVAQRIELVGRLGPDGRVVPDGSTVENRYLELTIPGARPVAVSVDAAFGSHEAGTVLFGAKLGQDSLSEADGRDCIIARRDGSIIVRRAAVDGKRLKLAAAADADSEPMPTDVDWIAPIMMSVRYYR